MKYCLAVLLFICSFTVTSQESTASKNVSSFVLYSPEIKADKKIWIYLPHNYYASDKRFPVLYMHDGQNLFDAKTSAFGEWRADETLDSLKAEVIVIGIEHGGEKRLTELTPYPNEKYGGGGADSYLDFVVKTLIPHVNKKYRTKTGAGDTAIMGSSLGGLVSFYALLKYPDVFGRAGVFSPSFWFNDAIYTFAENAGRIKGKIYFAAGDSESEDMVPDLERMEKIIKQKIKNPEQVFTKIVPEGKHNEKLWAGQFAAAYLWLMQ